MTVSTKKVIEVKKAKNILFHSKLILSTFCEKVNFLTASARSCRRCGQFDIGVTICFDDLQHLLISLAMGIQYVYDVELLYPLDEFQTNLIFNRET